jgi:hypothetical protein
VELVPPDQSPDACLSHTPGKLSKSSSVDAYLSCILSGFVNVFKWPQTLETACRRQTEISFQILFQSQNPLVSRLHLELARCCSSSHAELPQAKPGVRSEEEKKELLMMLRRNSIIVDDGRGMRDGGQECDSLPDVACVGGRRSFA